MAKNLFLLAATARAACWRAIDSERRAPTDFFHNFWGGTHGTPWKGKSDQVIRENPASRGTETSAEVLVGPLTYLLKGKEVYANEPPSCLLHHIVGQPQPHNRKYYFPSPPSAPRPNLTALPTTNAPAR